MSTFNNIPTGLIVPAQIPLDAKLYVADEASLTNLGVSNNLAFTYYEGMIVYCVAEKTRWEWREGAVGEIGLLPTGFTYPSPLIINGVDYSNKTFNFYRVVQNLLISNVGTGVGVYKGLNLLINTHEFKRLNSIGLTILSSSNEINIENKQGLNVGTGSEIYKTLNSVTKIHEFRTLKSLSPSITISQSSDEVSINTSLYNTIVTGGSGITVTGTGTVGNPYVVSLTPVVPQWLTGDIKEVYCTQLYMTTNFIQVGPNAGLGIGERTGWAICNGNNGTPNDNGRVVVAYGTSYPTLNATGGSKDAVLLSHHHYTVATGTNSNGDDVSNSLYDGTDANRKELGLASRALNFDVAAYDYELATAIGNIDGGKTSTTGGTGVDKNMQPYVVRLKIMKL